MAGRLQKSSVTLDMMEEQGVYVLFSRVPDDHSDVPEEYFMKIDKWEDFGKPRKVTITIRPWRVADGAAG